MGPCWHGLAVSDGDSRVVSVEIDVYTIVPSLIYAWESTMHDGLAINLSGCLCANMRNVMYIESVIK
jgi:hypothetical protein